MMSRTMSGSSNADQAASMPGTNAKCPYTIRLQMVTNKRPQMVTNTRPQKGAERSSSSVWLPKYFDDGQYLIGVVGGTVTKK